MTCPFSKKFNKNLAQPGFLSNDNLLQKNKIDRPTGTGGGSGSSGWKSLCRTKVKILNLAGRPPPIRWARDKAPAGRHIPRLLTGRVSFQSDTCKDAPALKPVVPSVIAVVAMPVGWFALRPRMAAGFHPRVHDGEWP
jgi:hypothetical protein